MLWILKERLIGTGEKFSIHEGPFVAHNQREKSKQLGDKNKSFLLSKIRCQMSWENLGWNVTFDAN